MKKTLPTTIIALLSLFILGAGAFAQSATNLTNLRVALWPEYDDPRLLVIVDGTLPAPGQTVRFPIPANADIHAVATTDATGGLINAVWETGGDVDGFVVVDVTSAGDAFRIEYYVPLNISGDQRQLNYELPAGYVAADTFNIETLLPPDATAVSASPTMQSPGEGSAPALVRQSGPLAVQDALLQDVSYNNPSGALTIPEDARPPAAQPAQQAQQAAPQAVAASPSADENPIDPVILILGALALALIAGGIFWLWRMRGSDAKPAQAPAQSQGKSRPTSPQTSPQASDGKGGDRYCRQCGTEFAGDDRFCRKCGASRR